MRLSNVERGDSLKYRIVYRIIKLASGFRAPDVVRTMFYRAKFFGDAHGIHTQEVMRGPSAWSVGDRELMAAFVSRLNECRF